MKLYKIDHENSANINFIQKSTYMLERGGKYYFYVTERKDFMHDLSVERTNKSLQNFWYEGCKIFWTKPIAIEDLSNTKWARIKNKDLLIALEGFNVL